MATVNLPKNVEFTDQLLLKGLLLHVLVLAAFGQTRSNDATPFFIIASVEGQVMVSAVEGEWQPVEAQQILKPGAQLLLDAYASAVIVDHRGYRYQLKPNSEIQMDQDGLRALRGTLQRLPMLSLSEHLSPLATDTSSRSVCGADRWSGVRLNGPGWLPVSQPSKQDAP